MEQLKVTFKKAQAVIVAIAACLMSVLGTTLSAPQEAEAAGGDSTISSLIGISRADFISYMETHANDYLGSPYKWDWSWGDSAYQNGPWYSNGYHPYTNTPWSSSTNVGYGMNCAGFPTRVFLDLGVPSDSGLMQDIWTTGGSGYHWANARAWKNQLLARGCEYRQFTSISQALSSGYMEKGDIIWMDGATDCHIGFFWGDSSSDNKFWHSSPYQNSGGYDGTNHITSIYSKDTPFTVIVIKWEKYGWLQLDKTYSDSGASNSAKTNNEYSLAGAEYGIYSDSDCTKKVGSMTTDSNGYAKSGDLKAGNYWVKETKASKGCNLDPSAHEYTVIAGQTVGPNSGEKSIEPVKYGYITIGKTSANTAISDGNRCYSLEDAEYTITDSDGKVVDTLKTDSEGHACSKQLLAGNYTVKETKASHGYGLDTNTYKATVKPDMYTNAVNNVATSKPDYTSATSKELPENDPPDAVAWKVDDETKDATPSGKATLKGAEFTVYYFDQENLTEDECKARVAKGKGTDGYTRHWVLKTDEDGYTSFAYAETEHDKYVVDDSDGWYLSSKGHYTLPVGTVYVVETKAPKGYNLGTVKTTKAVQYIQWQRDGKGLETVNTYNEPTEEDPTVGDAVKREDVHWDKKDENTGKSMKDIPFVIKSNTTGEWHVVVSDPNGVVSTSTVKHSTNTNAYDAAVTENKDGTFTVDQSKLDSLIDKYDYEVGTWFTGRSDKTTTPIDDRYALVYDDYTIYELRVKGNEDRSLVVNNIDVYRQGTGDGIDKGTIDDTQPTITTTAYDPIDNDQYVGEYNTVQINDLVNLTDVVEGTTYKVKAELHDAKTGDIVKDDSGKDITATKEVKATGKTASTTFEFSVNTLDKAGTTYVVYEYLYDWDGEEIAKHDDKDNVDQQITVTPPTVNTTLTSTKDGSKNVIKTGTVTVTDEVAYSNLVIGKAYTVSGVLHSKNDDGSDAGELKDASGKSITATKTFTATEASGTVKLDFTFDATGMEDGDQVVAFEDLYAGKKKVATHSEISDKSQTVTVKEPNLGTTAVDGDDGDKEIVIDAEATVVDTVKYENLVKGEKYNIKGELHVKTTDENGNIVDGGALKDENGNVITAESGEFTCDDPNGTINVTFNFAAAGILDEKTVLVVYETLYSGNDEIVKHHDIEDVDQAVTMIRPSIKTTAVDGHDGDKNVVRDEVVTIVDTVKYHNLVEGKTYKAYGQLYIKKQGGRWIATVDGEQFGTVKNEDGTTTEYEVTTNSDGTEYWYYTDEDKLNRVRLFQKDDAATGSTDWYLEVIENTGVNTDSDGSDKKDESKDESEEAGSAVKTTTTKLGADAVTTKQTDESDIYADKLLDAEGNEVKGETEFVAENTDGTVDVTFTFDGSKVPAGTRLVAFESMTENDVEIAVHADIEDEDQSVDVVEPNIGTMASDTLDGDKTIVADEESSITDKVSYENVLTNEKYTLAGILMDAETGLPIMTGEGATKYTEDELKTFMEDAETALTATEEYKAEDEDSDKDSETEDKKSEVTEDEKAEAVEDAKAKVDEVADKVTGAVTEDESKFGDDVPSKVYGSQVAAFEAKYAEMMSYMVIQTKEFTPEKAYDTTEMEFKFNANDVIDRLNGGTKKTVVYEVLFKGSLADAKDEKSEVTTVTLDATECDKDNEDQTVTITPSEIGTELTDKSDGDHEALNSTSTTLVDTVSYKGLIPGKEYTLKATLMDKSTGKELLVNDQKVTATLKFTPNSADGSVDIEIGPFDASALSGTTVVAFEELYKQVEVDGEITDTLIAEHKDINDEKQSVLITDKPGDKTSTPGQDTATLKTAESIAALLAAIAMLGAAGLLAAKKLRKRGTEE